jgi:SanA protein
MNLRQWKWKRIFFVLGVIVFVGLLFVFVVNRRVTSRFGSKAHDTITAIPVENPPRVAIVFGAGVWRGNRPSPALYDRVVTAVELYRSKRVKRILMSGDNRFENYNEPTVMKQTAIDLGVPAQDIIEDFAGRRTYDTCYRAKEIFNVNRAVLVTQEFHLKRALYLCSSLGIESEGIIADRRLYPTSSKRWWALRESFAIAGAWFDLNILKPTPILGEKIPIQ